MTISIFPAATASDYAAFGRLVTEYVEWSRKRYAEHPWFIEQVFGHQSLESELRELPETYGAPQGLALLASRAGEICAAGAYRRLDAGICEMKRVFVSNGAQGLGLGRTICTALIEAARPEGFRVMRLDTAHLMVEAIALYKSLGFVERTPYHIYPADLMPFMLFMEKDLTAGHAVGSRIAG